LDVSQHFSWWNILYSFSLNGGLRVEADIGRIGASFKAFTFLEKRLLEWNDRHN
jgi:hypothetical protein